MDRKIFLFGHSPFCRTGYGVIAKNLSDGLVNAGYNVEIYGIVSADEPVSFNVNGVKHHGFSNIYARGSWVLEYCKKMDIVITIIDTWISKFEFLQRLDRKVKLINYAIIDHQPLSPFVVESLKRADIVVAMSKFGYDELKSKGIDSVLIPVGVDLDVFKPVDKNMAKKVFNFEDRFVVFWNCQNHYRKGIEELFKAWKKFSHDKVDVILHIHTNTYLKTEKFEAYNLAEMIEKNEINKKSVVVTTENYSGEMMNLMYNASDIFLNTSYSGSYEIPLIESYAVKVPVIAPYSTAMAELVDEGGLGVKIKEKIPNYHLAKDLFDLENFTESKIRVVTPMLGYMFKPDVDDIVGKLDKLYYDEKLRCNLGEKGYEFVTQRDWKKIMERWISIL